MSMTKLMRIAGVLATLSIALSGTAHAQETQYMPILEYRTGAYAPTGTPLANGIIDYFKLVNERGGVNGVKLLLETCETGYDTARIMECYERMKAKNGGAIVFQPWSTGGTYAIAEKADVDKIPVLIQGGGRSESADGRVFKWVFPVLGNYWVASDILVQELAAREGGMDKLRGKKIALVYHDSPYGSEALPLLKKRAEMLGFELSAYPVTPPGAEQKSIWLQVRRLNPDYIILRTFGIMTPAALKSARGIGFPMERIVGAWPATTDSDVRDLGADAKGYSGVAMPSGPSRDSDLAAEVIEKLYKQEKGAGGTDESVGSVFWTRGAVSSMMVVEAMRVAQEEFGKGKRINGEQMQWGLEHINLSQGDLEELGFGSILRGPIRTSCEDHMGAHSARMQTWDGSQWVLGDKWYDADMSILIPMIEAASAEYAKAHSITPRDCAD